MRHHHVPGDDVPGDEMPGEEAAVDSMLSDEELTAEALSAIPDPPLGPEAVPFDSAVRRTGLLPEWYMPAPMSSRRTPVRVAVVAAVVLAFLAVAAAGLCTTNGLAEIAW